MTRRDYASSRGPMLWTVFCLMLCSLGFAGNASAVTLTVNTTADSSDAAGSCGTGTCSLRDAITQAAAGDTIQFASTVTPIITLLSPLPAIAANLTIAGPGANVLTVSGNNSATVGTIFTINTGVTASISGLTIANGNSNSSDQGGGGILNDGTLTVSNCTISGNSGTGSVNNEGGGVTNFGTMAVSGSTFSGNTAANGGGIFNGDGNTLTLTNSTFSGNSATAKGGGIYNLTGGTLTVTNSTISGNSGGLGGGIETNSSATTITNSIVAGNTATSGPDDIDGT
ncbi:MAG TPA: right-handed parallel beta-helix repeat-containing protein, partial [Silvibacterium sp.]|nr:right-handed parallel beta-helix repeat-containing protein [Silvibacterium sp.]